RIAVLYRAHHALAATTPGTEARQRAQGRWQRAFTDIDAHRILQASDAAKVIGTLKNEWDGLARHQDLPQLPLGNYPDAAVMPRSGPGWGVFAGRGGDLAA